MNKNVHNVFNSKAKSYADSYMDMSMYESTFNAFNNAINTASPKILDIACGPGNITKYIKSKNPAYNILGTDFAPKMISVAKAQNPDCTFREMDALSIDTLDQKFNGILCGFLLPYLNPEQVQSLFRKVYTQLIKGGAFYVSTMNSESNYSETTHSKSEPIQSLESFYYSKDYLIESLQAIGFKILDSSIKLDGYSAPLSELFITAKS